MHAWPADDRLLFAPQEPGDMNLQVFEDTLAQMNKLGISHAVLSGPNYVTAEWCRRAPHRFIASWMANLKPDDPEAEAACFAEAVDTQGIRGLGELIMQYRGLAVNDERFFPLYRVCAERHLPLFCHTGLDGPGSPMTPSFRVKLGDPLLFEDVAVAFPDLKIVMCHMSYPFTEQAIYMLYAHANVYMDVATVNWILGRAGFYRLLEHVVETVGPDKILFGSDQMNVPQMIPVAVSAIEEAPFLSAVDKCKILGDNARKLLGISL
jgi:hypothetical protein